MLYANANVDLRYHSSRTTLHCGNRMHVGGFSSSPCAPSNSCRLDGQREYSILPMRSMGEGETLMAGVEMMTASEFAAQRHELPDGGRWTELVAGETKNLHPPDDKHGDVVLNLSKAVARSLRPSDTVHASFEAGILTARDPDTVRFPAMSVFSAGVRFAGIDDVYITDVPALVVEVVSTNDRRTSIAERVYEYHRLGVRVVWVADPVGRAVTALRRDAPPVTYREEERLSDFTILPRFEIRTSDLFAVPDWWQGTKRSQ